MQEDAHINQIQLPPGAHFGQLKQIRDFGGLIMAQSHYAPRTTTPMHIHETTSFTVTLHGDYVEEHRSRVLRCSRKQILFRAAGEQHRNSIGPRGARCLILEIRDTWRDRLHVRRLPFAVFQLPDAGDFQHRLQRELILFDDVTPLAIEALVLDLYCQLQRARRARGGIPLWLRQLQEKLEAEFDGRHSLEFLARSAGVHPCHLARTFRQHFACSIGEYVRRRRVMFACEKIAAGEPLSHIAFAAGFANQPHFSRAFKAVTGLSPGQFRREECKPGAKNA